MIDFNISVDAIYKAVLPKLPADGELDIARRINEYPGGRQELLKNDGDLRDLGRLEDKFKISGSQSTLAKEPEMSEVSGPKSTVRKDQDDLKKLRESISSDVTDVIKDNFQLFAGKLKIELDRVEAGLKNTVERAGDRVIEVLSGGPWESIANEVSDHNKHSII